MTSNKRPIGAKVIFKSKYLGALLYFSVTILIWLYIFHGYLSESIYVGGAGRRPHHVDPINIIGEGVYLICLSYFLFSLSPLTLGLMKIKKIDTNRGYLLIKISAFFGLVFLFSSLFFV